MKLSVYNPTGSRVTVAGNGRFAGIVLRSLFATRGHQEFNVANQEHADWLIAHIKAACPSAQVRVIGNETPEPVSPVEVLEPVATLEAVQTVPVVAAVAEQAPMEEETTQPDAAVAPEDVTAKKTGGKKPKPVAENKE